MHDVVWRSQAQGRTNDEVLADGAGYDTARLRHHRQILAKPQRIVALQRLAAEQDVACATHRNGPYACTKDLSPPEHRGAPKSCVLHKFAVGVPC